MTAKKSVLGLGTVLIDHQVVLPTFPKIDTKNEIQHQRFQVGGPVPTALAVLRRLGIGTQFIGKWSNDPFGEMITTDLESEGIEFGNSIVKNEGSTGFAHVWVDQSTGSRTVAYCRSDTGEIQVSEMANLDLAPVGWLMLDGWSGDAAAWVADRVRQNGGRVFLDAGSPKPGTKTLLPFVDVMNCPRHFARQFFGHDDSKQASRQLNDLGVGASIFTHGDQGATLYQNGDEISQPAFPITAVDTTGAGDVFCGGFVFGLLQDWEAARCLEFAAATAALKCTQLGNRAAIPSLEQILACIG